MNLTTHFTLSELLVSGEAARRGIDNTPTPEALAALKRTALGLETVRMRLGGAPILISSGYRCLALNRAIGSKGGDHRGQHPAKRNLGAQETTPAPGPWINNSAICTALRAAPLRI